MESKIKVNYPPFWQKRRAKMRVELIEELEKSANSEVIESDEYGEYRAGVFLHKNTIVSVVYNNDLWALQIHCDEQVGLHLIEEIRYKYIPNKALMAHLLGSRESMDKSDVILYEIPTGSTEENESETEQ